MKKYILFVSIALVAAVLSGFYACTDEEEATDIRNQVVGTYDFTGRVVVNKDGELLDEYAEIGTLSVRKNSSDSKKIDFVDGGTISFSGSKIAKAANGVKFDVPTQKFVLEGETFTITGYNMFTLGSTKYNGVYYSDEKVIKVAFSSIYEGIPCIMILEGKKR
jgi:hypothetical protein